MNITVNTDDAGGLPDLNVLLEAYRVTLALDLSYVDLSGSDLSERDFGVTDLSRTNLSGADLTEPTSPAR